MSQAQINDNINLGAAKFLDDRQGKIVAGVQLSYATKEEATAKTLNRRPIGLQVDIVNIKHRWDGTDWIEDDAIVAKDEALTKIPLTQKNAVGGVPNIDTVSLNSTISGIRALSTTLKSEYYSTTDAGQEGEWKHISGIYTSGDDNGGTFLVDTLGRGYEKIIIGRPVSVIEFGCKGDGVTDDTTLFNKCLSVCKRVEVPEGYNFLVSNELIVPLPYTTITGSGTITQTNTAFDKNIFTVTAPNVQITGDILMNGAIGNGVGVFNSGRAMVFAGVGAENLLVERIRGVKQSGVVTKGINNVEVNFINIQASQMGIHFSGIAAEENAGVIKYVDTFKATGNQIVIADVPNERVPDANIRGIRTSWASNIIIEDNPKIVGFNLDIEVWRSVGSSFQRNATVRSNRVSIWVSFDGSEGLIDNNVIDFNTRPANAAPVTSSAFNYSPLGIEAIYAKNTTISYNRIYNLPGCGILTALPTQVTVEYAENVTLINNYIQDCGVLGFVRPAMALGACKGLKVFGGEVVRPKSGGVTLIGSTSILAENYSINNVTVRDGFGDAFASYYSKNIEINNCNGFNMKIASNDPNSGKGLKLGVNANARAVNITVRGGEYFNNESNDVFVETNNSNPSTYIEGTKAGKWRIAIGNDLLCKFSDIQGYRPLEPAIPIIGSWILGETYETASNRYTGKKCIVSGTVGTLTSVTGTGTIATRELTVNSSEYLLPNNYITLTGSATVYRIVGIVGNVLTLSVDLDQTVSSVAVSFSPPTFDNYGYTDAKETAENRFKTPISTTDPFTLPRFELGSTATSWFIKGSTNNDVNFPSIISVKGNNGVYVQSKPNGTDIGEDRLSFSKRYATVTTSNASYLPSFYNEFLDITVGGLSYVLTTSPTVIDIVKLFRNKSSGIFTLTPNTGVTIDGQTGTPGAIVLQAGEEVVISTKAKDVWLTSGRVTLGNGSTSSASTLTVDVTKDNQIFTGTTGTWTWPVITGNTWKRIFVKNRGSGNLTINSNAGANDFYLTAPTNTLTVAAGTAIILVADGVYWNIE